MKSPIISIIVPVYKTEKYICRCLDSIIAQTFTEWECILVDDGSPDTSGSICDEYAKKDKRFKVFHQENSGVSAARNKGLDNAKGEWIGFVDSDDWIEPETYEIAYKSAIKTGADLIQWGFVLENGKQRRLKQYEETTFSHSTLKSLWEPSMCNKLVFAKTIFDNCLVFPIGIKLSEDKMFAFQCYLYAKKCYSITNCFYHYIANEQSATHAVSKDMILQEVEVIKKMELIAHGEMDDFIFNEKKECKEHALRLLNPLDCELCRNIFAEINDSVINKSNAKMSIIYYFLFKKRDSIVKFIVLMWKYLH